MRAEVSASSHELDRIDAGTGTQGDRTTDAEATGRPARVVAPRLEEIAFQDVFEASMPWRFTTEAIEAYLPHLAAEGRRCLTVAGSGDQAVDLLAAGASEVVIFDSMSNALAMTDHKLTTLRDWQDDCGTFMRTYGTDWQARPTSRRDDDRSPANYIVGCLGRIGAYDPTIPIFKGFQIRRRANYHTDEDAFRHACRAVDDALAQGRVRSVQTDVRDLVRIPRIGTFDVVVLSNIVSTIVRSLRRPAQILDRPFSNGRTSRQEDETVFRGVLDDTVWRTAALLRPGGVMVADVLYGLSDYSHDEEDLAKVDPVRLEEMVVAEETRIEEELVAVTDRGDEEELADIDDLIAAAIRERRRRLWSPPPGFTVSEIVLNENDMSGHDVAVIVRRDPA